MKVKSIYDLGLHESVKVCDNVWVRRVAGGWLYRSYVFTNIAHKIEQADTTFVPYHNEFEGE